MSNRFLFIFPHLLLNDRRTRKPLAPLQHFLISLPFGAEVFYRSHHPSRRRSSFSHLCANAEISRTLRIPNSLQFAFRSNDAFQFVFVCSVPCSAVLASTPRQRHKYRPLSLATFLSRFVKKGCAQKKMVKLLPAERHAEFGRNISTHLVLFIIF